MKHIPFTSLILSFFAVFALFLQASCSIQTEVQAESGPSPSNGRTESNRASNSVPDLASDSTSDEKIRELSKFLAGLELGPNSPYASLAQKSYYRKRHLPVMKKFWKDVRLHTLKHMQPWQKEYMPPGERTNAVLYPLSGADLVNLYTVYPDAKEYVMFALEQPGSVPDLLNVGDRKIAKNLHHMRRVISTIGSKNYFYSAYMRNHMKAPTMKGVAPVLMVFAAGMGLDVEMVSTVRLDDQGRVVLDDPAIRSKRGDVRGVRLVLRSPKGDRKVLTYWNIRINRNTMKSGTKTGEYFKHYRVFNVIMKSAVYLLHYNRYAGIRDFILKRARRIVQDDTGIPFRFFRNERWDTRLFGDYVSYRYTIGGIGRPPYQADLDQAYKKNRNNVPPMYFRFGYGGLNKAKFSTLMILSRQ